MLKAFKLIVKLAVASVVVAALVVAAANWYMCYTTGGSIFKTGDVAGVEQEVARGGEFDAIVVLGAQVMPDGTLSEMLGHRVDAAVAAYKTGAAPKIIMSGDNSTETYNESDAMRAYAIECGVPEGDVLCDYAGFSTYDSMYRAQAIFGVECMLVVSQEYHLPRAIWCARARGMEAFGIGADYNEYGGQLWYDLREALARVKDMVKCASGAEPTFLGEQVSLSDS